MNPDPCPVCDGLGHEYLADDSTRSCATCCGSGQRPARMVSADHCARLWADAGSYGELCELTALWLEGRLPFSYNYGGVPDEEPDGVTDTALIALNRAGYLTEGSQPGHGWIPGWDGAGYRQRAHVDLLVQPADVFRVFRATSTCPDLWVKCRPTPRWWPRWDRDVCRISEAGEYTPEGAEASCWAGGLLPRKHWRHLGRLSGNPAMGRILSDCWQFAIVDLTWGRNDVLWDTLTPLTIKEKTHG